MNWKSATTFGVAIGLASSVMADGVLEGPPTFIQASDLVVASSSVLVYDNLSAAAAAGYWLQNSEQPVFGDSMTLTQGGPLAEVGLSLYNSSSSAGNILAGNMQVSIYDNTIPYVGGVLNNPLLGTANFSLDFSGSGGLLPGYYTTGVFDVSSLGILLPTEILVTQFFSQTQGTANGNGVVIFAGPVVGTSWDDFYLKTTTQEGLYWFGGPPAPVAQIGYSISIVPEPTPFLAAGLLLGFAGWRWHRHSRRG